MVAAGVGEATQAGPLPRLKASDTPARVQKVSDADFWGEEVRKLQDCSQDGAPDATVHQLLASTIALLGHWQIRCPHSATEDRHLSISAPLDMSCVDGSMCSMQSTGISRVLACEILSNVPCIYSLSLPLDKLL